MKKQRGFTFIEILVVIAVLIITASGVVVWKEKVSPTPTPVIPNQTPIPSSRSSPVLSPFATEIKFEDLDSNLTCISIDRLKNEYRKEEFVINSREEYQTLYNYRSPSDPCKDYALPEIDFSQNTLIGKYTDGGGCSINFVRKIYQDNVSKEIVYLITVVEEGGCKKMRIGMNWALAPKIPSDYTVRFEVK